MKRRVSLLWVAALALAAAGCVSAEPEVVAQAVDATLAARPTATPIVIVVTAVGVQNQTIVTVTPAPPSTATAVPTAAPSATPSAAPLTSTAPVSPTPPPLASPSPTNTAVPTPTSTPSIFGRLAFSDDFTQPGTWDLSNDSTSAKAITGGVLSMTLKLTDRYTVLYKAQSVPNVYIQVTGQAPACHTRDRYGVVFRVKDIQNYYLFDVDCDGRYRVAKMVDGELTPLVDWTANAALNVGAGAVNDLTVRAADNQLGMSANGHSLAKLTDDTFRVGGFGVYTGSGLTVPYTATFQKLRVWETLP